MEKSTTSTFLRRRSAWLGTAMAQFSILGLGVISGVASARLLGPQGRGELAAITLWPMAFAFLGSFGFNQAIVFFTGKKRHTISEVWTTAGVIGLAESLVVVTAGIALMPLLLRHYSETVRHLGLIFLLASPALILTGIPANLFQGRGDLFRFNLLRMIAPAVYTCGLLTLLILNRPNLKAVVWILATSYVAALVLGVIVIYRRERPKFCWSAGAAPEFLKYGAKTHLANLTSYFNQRADQLILALLIPAQQLGLYAVAVTIATSVNFFSLAAGIVTFSRGSNQSDEALKRTIAKSFRLSLLWLLLACSALFFVAPFLITRVLGPNFAGSIIA
ncbi:MAG: oligosaccharide flippase family protein, partial [Candidatus Angelobacter sp.]